MVAERQIIRAAANREACVRGTVVGGDACERFAVTQVDRADVADRARAPDLADPNVDWIESVIARSAAEQGREGEGEDVDEIAALHGESRRSVGAGDHENDHADESKEDDGADGFEGLHHQPSLTAAPVAASWTLGQWC